MKMGPCIVRVLQRNTNIMYMCVYRERERDFKPLTHEFVEIGKSERGWHGRAGRELELETKGRVDIAA